MKNLSLNDSFLEAVKEKESRKSALVNLLTDILAIEKESVYRRLRGEVPFTLNEAGIISKQLGLSVDNMIMGTKSKSSAMIQMMLPATSDVNDLDDTIISIFLDKIKDISEQPYSERGEALNLLPSSIYAPYPNLSKFYVLKWHHLYGNGHSNKKMDEIEQSDRSIDLQKQVNYYQKYITESFFILDSAIISNLINDLRYFESIRLVNESNVQAIKKELYEFLTYWEQLAAKGRYSNTGNKVDIYISSINLSVTYSYLWSEDYFLSQMTTFLRQAVGSYEKESCEKIKYWLNSLKRLSTLISGVGEKDRIQFFDKQRSFVDEL
ncbi:hypothetical protein [Parabacteroides sp. PF5-9]|uniref:hypothetical protein n=1 Tax=Parabacteroides sp. PF5-9 TaxID=1742404 RepID=UPI0024751C15|nr:hypothetical protein [Parabacteroides sp. PF5-9]MDH6358621.1 hypothetical protein [Parabacteroides sp. PF5-9]